MRSLRCVLEATGPGAQRLRTSIFSAGSTAPSALDVARRSLQTISLRPGDRQAMDFFSPDDGELDGLGLDGFGELADL